MNFEDFISKQNLKVGEDYSIKSMEQIARRAWDEAMQFNEAACLRSFLIWWCDVGQLALKKGVNEHTLSEMAFERGWKEAILSNKKLQFNDITCKLWKRHPHGLCYDDSIKPKRFCGATPCLINNCAGQNEN